MTIHSFDFRERDFPAILRPMRDRAVPEPAKSARDVLNPNIRSAGEWRGRLVDVTGADHAG